MGRANVYLPDDLERRVKAARLPVSEICQQALLVAVEAAEAERPVLGEAVAEQFRRGREAGDGWARDAGAVPLLSLVRDQRLERIPPEVLPVDWYSLGEESTVAWEAGFMTAARAAAEAAVEAAVAAAVAAADAAVDGPAPATDREAASSSAPDDDTSADDAGPTLTGSALTGSAVAAAEPPRLGDGSTSYVGVDDLGRRIAFDPHTAVVEGRSPLFAVLGAADQRARLGLSIGQDAACRGVAVLMLDLSGQLAPRARGLGKIVRIPSTAQPPVPGLDALLGSVLGSSTGWGAASGAESGLRGLWEVLAGLSTIGGGIFPGGAGSGGAAGATQSLVTPGYVTVLTTPADGSFGGVLGAVNAVRALGELTTKADHQRLLLVDLPDGVTVPAQLAGALGRLVRTARQADVALGLSAGSAGAVADVGGTGALLSTVFAFPTSSPVEADRLRDLLGAQAPVLLNPPGYAPRPDDEVWCTMRDLEGRLGQVRLDIT